MRITITSSLMVLVLSTCVFNVTAAPVWGLDAATSGVKTAAKWLDLRNAPTADLVEKYTAEGAGAGAKIRQELERRAKAQNAAAYNAVQQQLVKASDAAKDVLFRGARASPTSQATVDLITKDPTHPLYSAVTKTQDAVDALEDVVVRGDKADAGSHAIYQDILNSPWHPFYTPAQQFATATQGGTVPVGLRMIANDAKNPLHRVALAAEGKAMGVNESAAQKAAGKLAATQ